MSPLEPDPADSLIAEAGPLFAQARHREARELLQRAVEEAESAHGRVRAYIELGRTYEALGKRQSAQSCYRRVLSLTDDWTYRDRARRLYRGVGGRFRRRGV